MDSGLLFHRCDHSQIDLLHGQTIEVCVQQDIQLQKRLIIQFPIHCQDIVLDHIAFGNDDCQNLSGIYPGQLDELHLVMMYLRSTDHGGILCVLSQSLDYLF